MRAANCILACWHVVIPYIAQELPDAQKEALASAQKVPLLYNNVLVRNWSAFQKLGASAIYRPGMYHTSVNLDLPVSIGGYECTKKPDEPIVVHMMKAACKPGRPAREQHKLGRIQLYSTTFETYERNIREQLARMLGPGGFDPARDILEITVNRWPHGYAYEYNSLFDEFWLEGGETPCQVARKPFGRLAIANSDADAYAYTDCAIDQAYRAVQELKRISRGLAQNKPRRFRACTAQFCETSREVATKGGSPICSRLRHRRSQRRQGAAFVGMGCEKDETLPDVLAGHDSLQSSSESGTSACDAGVGSVARRRFLFLDRAQIPQRPKPRCQSRMHGFQRRRRRSCDR